MQTVRTDSRERLVVEHDDRVRVVHEALETEERIVRLHDDVWRRGIRKHRVRLDELLGVAVVEALEDVRAQPRARPAGDRVQEHECLGDERMSGPASDVPLANHSPLPRDQSSP